jgi:hypothetical protein
MTEEWKDIEGYENLYQVSNMGRVKSLGNGKSNKSKLKIMKTTLNHKGYPMIGLMNNGVKRTFSVHRLVAKAFIPNPDNLPQVNHIDEVKTNNCVENLEWCTNEYNHNYGTRIERVRQKQIGNPNLKTCLGKFGKDNPTSKPIIQFTMDGELVRMWFAARDAEREEGYNSRSISACCSGKRHTHKGSHWEYYETDRYLIALMNKTIKDREKKRTA